MKQLSVPKLAFLFAGCFLGAGFVPGQQLRHFFGCFGGRRFAGLAVSVVLFALCGILLPLLACLLIYSGHYDGFAFWLRQFFGQIIYFSIKAAFVYPFVGVTLGLLGFPAGKAATANAPESPIQPH